MVDKNASGDHNVECDNQREYALRAVALSPAARIPRNGLPQDTHEELELERTHKNEFLAMLGHELRNPLAALSYGLEFLELAEEPEKRQKTQQMMTRQLQRIKSMLDQLLEVSKVSQGKVRIDKKLLDFAQVARDAIEVVAPHIAKRNQRLSVALPDSGAIWVLGDPNRLAQVMENLLINALKYTDNDGSIEVRVEQEQTNALFSVTDTGAGIDEALMPTVFDLFVQSARTLDRSEGGLGLGLPLAKELVELHGGDIAVESEGADKGSTFSFSIPIAEAEMASDTTERDDAGSAEQSHSEQQNEQQKGEAEPLRILVIDDEPDLAELFVRLLQRKGYAVKMATDGLEGIRLARSFRPRVILLDLGLPELDGYQVARRLRDEFGDTPLFIVAVSGYSKESKKLEQAGFDNHLLKPPDMNRLHQWIEALD